MLWLLRFIASFLILQGALGDDEEEFPQCFESYKISSTEHTTGYIQSYHYHEEDGRVSNVTRCQYRIHIPHGHGLRILMGHMDLEPSDFCSQGGLQINDTRTVRTLCGTTSIHELVFAKGVEYVHLSFRSEQHSKMGFSLHYETSPHIEQCPGQKRCGNGKCYDDSHKCNGYSECGDGTDEEGCDLPPATFECGLDFVNLETIMDESGDSPEKEVHPGMWPWQVSLQNRHTDFSYICGGTLINSQWILTAASCFKENPDPNYWQVDTGVHYKYYKDINDQIRYVEKILIWPNNTDGDLFDSNDEIALVKLNAPAQIAPHAYPVCLPQSGKDVQPGTRCYAAGWGRGSDTREVLKLVGLNVMSTSNCSYDPSTQICVKNPGCQSACQGDTGSPLVTKLESKWYVVGLAINRKDGNNTQGLHATTNESIIFTKVSDKAEWIRKMGDTGSPLVTKFESKWYVVGLAINRKDGNNTQGLHATTNESIIFTKVSDKAEWIRKMVDKYS